MKKLYSSFMLLAMIVAALGLTTCGGGDDDIGNSSPLVGTWKLQKTEGWNSSSTIALYFQFKADGKYIRIEEKKNKIDISSGTWELTNNSLTIREGNKSSTYSIVEIKKDEFSIKIFSIQGHYQRVPDSEIDKYMNGSLNPTQEDGITYDGTPLCSTGHIKKTIKGITYLYVYAYNCSQRNHYHELTVEFCDVSQLRVGDVFEHPIIYDFKNEGTLTINYYSWDAVRGNITILEIADTWLRIQLNNFVLRHQVTNVERTLDGTATITIK